MSADFQGELLALLNGNDEGLSSSNNNSNRQQQHLSRRTTTGGGNGLVATNNASPHTPPAPVPSCIKNSKDKSSNLRQRLRRSRKDTFIFLAVGSISLVCIIYVVRGYRIKFRIRLPSMRRSSSSLVSTTNEQSSTTTRGGTTTAHNANSNGGHAVTSTRSNPTFIDPAWVGNDEAQYQTLLPPSDIDFSIPRRSRWVKGKDRHCDNVLLFLSPSSSRDASYGTNLTHGTYELRGYFMAAMMATYTNRALVVLDAPMDVNVEKRSWYDCEATSTPVDEMVGNEDAGTPLSIVEEGQGRRRRVQRRTKGNKDRQNNQRNRDRLNNKQRRRPTLFNGLNHLIQHPQWLSHGCPVPCQSSYDYAKWNDLRDTNIQWEEEEEQQSSNSNIDQQQQQQEQHQVTCHNDNNRQATVFIVRLDDVSQHFTHLWHTQMSIRPNYNNAYQWAINLGAKGHEARTFASLEHSNDIWDYATALMARSGMIRFQQSFASEIKTRIKSSTLPLNWPYTAISTYREEIAIMENEEGTATSTANSNKRPRELLIYFQQLERVQCKISNSNVVYIATDDPSWVQDEIDIFLRGSSPNCRNVQFILSNNNNNDVSAMIKQGDDYCTQLHREKVNVMADLMILAKSETYVGGGIGEKGWMDMSSSDNVAWLVRTVRTLVGSPSDANTCY